MSSALHTVASTLVIPCACANRANVAHLGRKVGSEYAFPATRVCTASVRPPWFPGFFSVLVGDAGLVEVVTEHPVGVDPVLLTPRCFQGKSERGAGDAMD